MSSSPGNKLDSTPRFSPPQSAQPQGSLFGGPSGQHDDSRHVSQAQQSGANAETNELDMIMREMPMVDNNSSDDSTHKENDEELEPEEHAIDNVANDENLNRKESGFSQQAQAASESPPSSPQYRPNRFRGSENTWRHLTAEDRRNVEALEVTRARDLSAHLYNAYALRVRARNLAQSAQTVEHPDSQLDDSEAFFPFKGWTAWPMHAAEVPRLDEHLRKEEDDKWTLRMRPDMRPSADLEESIIAFLLKTAKERFNAREWKIPKPVRKVEKDESEDEQMVGKHDPEVFEEIPLHPVVQADDEKSRRQLRPLTRNILTQLDHLLVGLHRSQIYARGAGRDTASEPATDTDYESGNPKPDQKRRRSSEAIRRSSDSGSEASSTESSTSRDSARSESTESQSGPTDKQESRKSFRHGLRDWSDVLGVASMSGFPAAVVMRAAQRCSSLFGEDMIFQTVKEGRIKRVQTEDGPDWKYWVSDSEGDELSRLPPRPRSKRPQSRPPSGSKPETTRVKTDATRSVKPETKPSLPPGVPKPKGKGKHRKKDIICPVVSCPRHEDGFSRRWNLNLHVKRMHTNHPMASEIEA